MNPPWYNPIRDNNSDCYEPLLQYANYYHGHGAHEKINIMICVNNITMYETILYNIHPPYIIIKIN
jgi:hypothetical protein